MSQTINIVIPDIDRSI